MLACVEAGSLEGTVELRILWLGAAPGAGAAVDLKVCDGRFTGLCPDELAVVEVVVVRAEISEVRRACMTKTTIPAIRLAATTKATTLRMTGMAR